MTGRKKTACLTGALEAATEQCLANKNKAIHKLSAAFRAVVFMKITKSPFDFVLLLSLFFCLLYCHSMIFHCKLLNNVNQGHMSHAEEDGGVQVKMYFYSNHIPINDELSFFPPH